MLECLLHVTRVETMHSAHSYSTLPVSKPKAPWIENHVPHLICHVNA